MNTIEVHPTVFDPVYDALAELDFVQKQLGYLNKEKFRVDQQFVATQVEMLQGQKLDHSGRRPNVRQKDML